MSGGRGSMDRQGSNTRVIWVDFRKGRLSIDGDLYLKNVVEIHCRKCQRRKPRKNALELLHSWGYLCQECRLGKEPPAGTAPAAGRGYKAADRHPPANDDSDRDFLPFLL